MRQIEVNSMSETEQTILREKNNFYANYKHKRLDGIKIGKRYTIKESVFHNEEEL